MTARPAWMAVLARAALDELQAAGKDLPPHRRLRGPEVGMVMVRGRIGGTGAPFSLGEMTVTRCTVAAGEQVGHATIAGRDMERAELAARLDAALQDPALHAALDAEVQALATRQAAQRAQEARRAAATRVNFATLAVMR